MPSIDTPLLIEGHGPGALVAAKVASGRGLACLVAGHEPVDDDRPVVLDDESVAVLEPHGVLGVLRPYASAQAPFTITPALFERGLKHHCVADMLVTVYDRLWVEDRRPEADRLAAVLTDGRTRWDLRADAHLDAATMPVELNGAIHGAAQFATAVVDRISESRATG